MSRAERPDGVSSRRARLSSLHSRGFDQMHHVIGCAVVWKGNSNWFEQTERLDPVGT